MVIPSAQKAERPRRRLRHGCQSRPVRSVKFPPHRPPTPIGKANRRDLQMCKRATFAQVWAYWRSLPSSRMTSRYRAVCRERSGPTQRRSHRCGINAVRETLLRYWFDAEVCDVGLRRSALIARSGMKRGAFGATGPAMTLHLTGRMPSVSTRRMWNSAGRSHQRVAEAENLGSGARGVRPGAGGALSLNTRTGASSLRSTTTAYFSGGRAFDGKASEL
jgi:hypothetical protein